MKYLKQMAYGWRRRARIGVDIGPEAVRLLQLDANGASLRALHHAAEPLPPGAVAAGQIVDVEAVGTALARARARSGSSARHAVVALSAQAVRIRMLAVPAGLHAADLEVRLELEATRLMPAASSPPHLDFAVLDADPETPWQQQVLLAVADADAVQRCQRALHAARLHAAVIELESFALARALSMLAGRPLPPETALGLTRSSAMQDTSAPQLATALPPELAAEAPAWLLACGLALFGRTAWTST